MSRRTSTAVTMCHGPGRSQADLGRYNTAFMIDEDERRTQVFDVSRGFCFILLYFRAIRRKIIQEYFSIWLM